MENDTIENLQYIKEITDLSGLRIWKVFQKDIQKDVMMSPDGTSEPCFYWYQLVYSEYEQEFIVNNDKEWPIWPMTQNLFDEILSGAKAGYSCVFSDNEALRIRLTYNIK
jgi:hypothetical protein